ncbi:MAG: ImmA/IrrE family metallo-endopeptidase [Gemmataceae bacterium]|nr:ImmA/IrrE family metallo-endopeptidase [Gemmataceae bacterium]
MREDLSRDEVIAAIDEVVTQLLARARVQKPPVDALALARDHLGLAVSFDEEQPRGRGKRGRILIARDQSEERQQWTAAHAIGHHLKPDVLRRLGVEPPESPGLLGRAVPNLLARRLLVPACWFADDAPGLGYDVARLKERYGSVSTEVVAMRVLDLPEPCIISVVDNGHIRRRRSNAWRVNKQLEPPEQECQRYVHEYSRPRLVNAKGWTVWGWPFHRPDFKREVLRSVVDPDAVEVERAMPGEDEW